MSDFIKNLRSIFVTEETTSSEASESTEKDTPTAPVKPSAEEITGHIPRAGNASEKGKISPKFTKILLEAIEKHNMEGFDYLEFKNSVQSLAKMEMDEATRYKSAFAMAQTMGAKSTALIKSADHYLRVLTEEKRKFDHAANQQMQSKVHDKRSELKMKEKLILEKEKQIEKLQKEILALRSDIGKADQALATEEDKVMATQADFVASYNNLYNQIAADIEKMTNYLK